MLSKTVLFVDDEVSILKTIQRQFRHENFNLLVAPSGREALEIMATQKVHILVSDHTMPSMTGAELLYMTKLRYPHIVRIMMSGNADKYSIIEALNNGRISHYLTKPWDKYTLSKLLNSYLSYLPAPNTTEMKDDAHNHLHQIISAQQEQIETLKKCITKSHFFQH